MATFAALLIDGIAYGMMLFLISAGLTVTLGVMRVVNLSHSAFAMIGGYLALHELGWAHSVEAWTPDGVLSGGVYGVAIGGLFAAESMFHRSTDSGKAALAGLVALLRDGGATLLDVQWTTPHLSSLGAVDVPRVKYLELLAEALDRTGPAW